MGIGKGSGRGGARKNAGRPLGSGRHNEPTVALSIPLSRLAEVRAIIEEPRDPPERARPYPHPIPSPGAGEVEVLKRASAQDVIAAAKQQGKTFKVVVLDPMYRDADARGRAQFAAECIPLITAAAQITEHLFIFGWSASLGTLLGALPPTLDLRQWVIWHYTNVPAETESWRPAHQSCLHLSNPDTRVFPENLYRPSDLPLASFTRIKHTSRPYNVITAGHIHGNIAYKSLGTRKGEKPAKLIDVMLRMTMNPGDLVLDPTCGTGTTGEVAISNGYGAVLSDRSASALKHTSRRLQLAHERKAEKQARFARLVKRWQNRGEKKAKAMLTRSARDSRANKSKTSKASSEARRARAILNSAGELLAAIESRLIRGLYPTTKQRAETRALAQEVFGRKSAAIEWMRKPVVA